jgi:FkbM family methyltransferase
MNIDATETSLRRATLAISCRDAELIPKVANAGAVETMGGKPVQIMHNGLKVMYGGYHGDWMATVIHGLRGHHEPQEERAFYEILRYCRPKTSIVELGAFWAYYSMWYLKRIPFSHAYCLEPDASHIAVGQENMRLNGLEATFTRGCIGDQYISEHRVNTDSGESVVIPQHNVPSLMAHFGLDKIELLHADVQGAELGLLSSCAPLFADRQIRFVVVSTHHSSISGSVTTHSECLALLKQNGAHILCEHDSDESFSGDGLVVAAMRTEDKLIPPVHISRCRRGDSLFVTGY